MEANGNAYRVRRGGGCNYSGLHGPMSSAHFSYPGIVQETNGMRVALYIK